ncbi:MAG: hypothetical protein WC989_03165 [Micavibrio sp.]
MRKLLFIIPLVVFSLPVQAQAQEANADGLIELPGNAYVRPGNNHDNIYIYRKYGLRDYAHGVLEGRGLGPHDNAASRRFPSEDFSEICGNVTRAAERRRCRSDVLDLNKDRQKLYDKYN